MNLFSVFNPSGLLGVSLNWLGGIWLLLMLPCGFWLIPNQNFVVFSGLSSYLFKEMYLLKNFSMPSSSLLLTLSLFYMILFTNLLGMLPYFFTCSTHLVFTLSLAFPLWVGHFIMGWVIASNRMFSHLLPLGTPPALMSFMVLIELISGLIRPLTLSVRLAANLTAGHLIMTLIGNSAFLGGLLGFFTVLFIIVLIIVLESGVALIQSYVFSSLSLLYVNEVDCAQMSNV